MFEKYFHKFLGRCEEINLEICNSLSYNVTTLPNFLGHLTQTQISLSPEYLQMTSLMHSRYPLFFQDYITTSI